MFPKCGLSYLNPRPDPTKIQMNYTLMADDAYTQEEAGQSSSFEQTQYLNI